MTVESPKDDQKFKELVTEARGFVCRLGTERLGAPSLQAIRKLDAIDNLEHLEALADRLIDPQLASWDDLLHEA
jgi:hypothetical protein